MDQHVARGRSREAGTRSLRRLWSAGGHVAWSLAVLATLAGCASLAVRPCDTIEDRDGKYVGRFFLGVATLGLSEVTIQHEEVRQAYEGSSRIARSRSLIARANGVAAGPFIRLDIADRSTQNTFISAPSTW
jgi:hypothetical protein